MSLRLLAFDTSASTLSVAVSDGSSVLAANETGGARASARMLPLAHELLERSGLTLRALHGIAFGRGPGAFTGLRASCAVAQGLAFGLGCPVLPLSSLMLVAEDARVQLGDGGPCEIAVAMDARIDQIFAARFGFDGRQWHETSPSALLELPQLLAQWDADPPGVVAGSALDAFGPRLARPTCARFPREADRAAALIRLALQRWSPAQTVAADAALPLYLRDKVALTTRERDDARRARQGPAAARQATP